MNQDFYKLLKATKTELQVLNTGNSNEPKAFTTFRKFLSSSIHFFTTSTASWQQRISTEWYDVLYQVLMVASKRKSESENMLLTHKQMITYVCHFFFHMIKIEWVPSDWLLKLGDLMLELIGTTSSNDQSYIGKVIPFLYGSLQRASQKVPKNTGIFYKLLILAHAIQNTDTSKEKEDNLQLAGNILNHFIHQKNIFSVEDTQKIFSWSLNIYNSKHREPQSKQSQLYFVYLFRVLMSQKSLCKALLATSGNLYQFQLPVIDHEDLSVFKNLITSSLMNENENQAIVKLILEVTIKLSSFNEWQYLQNKKIKLIKLIRIIELQNKGIDLLKVLAKLYSSHQVHLAIVEALKAFTMINYDVNLLSCSFLFVLYQLYCITIAILVNYSLSDDVLPKSKKISDFLLTFHYLAKAENNKYLVMVAFLKNLQDLPKNFTNLAEFQKAAMRSLIDLSYQVSKKQFLCGYINQINEILKRSVLALEKFGYTLHHNKMYNQNIVLLSTLWSTCCVDMLFSNFQLHVCLVESYRCIHLFDEAYEVISDAAKRNVALLTDKSFHMLVKLVIDDPQIPILTLLEFCMETPKKHTQMLIKVLNIILSRKPNHKLIVQILECLSCHSGLEATEKAIYSCHLADAKWICSIDVQEKILMTRELLEILSDCIILLEAQPSRQYNDVLATAAFLFSELNLRKASCKIHFDTSKSSEKTNTNDSHFKMITSAKMQGKIIDCLKIWVSWFNYYKNDLMNWEDGRYRIIRSLSFLNKVSELALLSHKAMTALQCTCYARNLAGIINDTVSVKKFTTRILLMMADLGVKYDGIRFNIIGNDSDTNGSENIPTKEEDIFLTFLGLDEKMDVLDLAYLASYYYKIGAINKYKYVHHFALDLIQKDQTKGPNIILALAIIKRLSADYYSSPQCNEQIFDPDMLSKTYPTILAEDSVNCVQKFSNFYFEKDYMKIHEKDLQEEPWRIISEYLQSLKLAIDLFLYAGDVTSAKTYIIEALNVTGNCGINIWYTLFQSRQIQVALIRKLPFENPSVYLKEAFDVIETVGNIFVSYFCDHEAENNYSSCSSSDARQEHLLHINFSSANSKKNDGFTFRLLSSQERCNSCFNPAFAEAITELMWLQADMASIMLFHSKENSIQVALKLLGRAGCNAQKINNHSFIEPVQLIFLAMDIPWSVSDSLRCTNCEWVMETNLRLAETYLLSLRVGYKMEGVTSEAVEDILNEVIESGTTSFSSRRCNVLIATAHLLKANAKYIDILPTTFNAETIKEDRNIIYSDLKKLRDSLKKLKKFPEPFIYSQIKRCLAIEEFNQPDSVENKFKCELTNQEEIAALLTDSMFISYQHMIIHNFGTKLRHLMRQAKGKPNIFVDYVQLHGKELFAEINAISKALKKPNMCLKVDTLQSRLSDIPKDWTVVQLTIFSYDLVNIETGQLLITRLTSGQQPLTVKMPDNRWPLLRRTMRYLKASTLITNNETKSSAFIKNADLQKLVCYLQDVVLEGLKWLLKGQVDLNTETRFEKYLDKRARTTMNLIKLNCGYLIDQNKLKVIMEVLLFAPEDDVKSLVQSVWHKDISDTVIDAVLNLQQEVGNSFRYMNNDNRGPVILILDKYINALPWESMPDFKFDVITRMPSLSSLLTLLTWHTFKKNSSFLNGLDCHKCGAVIEPDNNFASKNLTHELQKLPSWSLLKHKAPTVEELRNFLSNYQIYLYCGHGWGKKFVKAGDVQMFHAKSVALLMGCDSGKIEYNSKSDGDGAPLHFLLAGCPSILGSLWGVYDYECDNMILKLLHEIKSQKCSTSLNCLLAKSKDVCEFPADNGNAFILYGLPLKVN